MTSNNLFSTSQHRFLAEKSCVTQKVDFMEYITEHLTTAIDIVKLLSLALSKIPHEKRLHKIYNYGITE